MGRGNIVYHNLRMNLDNEQHRRVHAVLADLNRDVHKSVNQFLVDAADAYIQSLGGQEAVRQEQKGCTYVTKEELEQLRKDIREEMQWEIIRTFGMALAGDRSAPGAGNQTVRDTELAEARRDDADMADETTIGLGDRKGEGNDGSEACAGIRTGQKIGRDADEPDP